MKRALDFSTGVHKIGPKTSDNSTSTGSHMKRIKRDGRPKHLRRGASHASSAQEYMKSEWTCDELDLNKQITSLSDLTQDKFKLVEELFSVFSILELKEFTPDILKEYSINQLKELCLEELNTISTSKTKFITEGNDPEDYVEPENNIDDKAIGDTSDGIQLSVDDNEYSDFLGAENLEPRRPKKEVRDAEVQANWSSLESSSSDDSHSDHRDGEGWMNLWKLEQMEILELEMRARAIRMLLKQEDEDGSTQKSTLQTKDMQSIQTIQTTNSNIDNKDRTECEDNRSDLEAGEIPDIEDNPNDVNIGHKDSESLLNVINNQNLNIENKDNCSEELIQNEVPDNGSVCREQSNEETVLSEDINEESNADKRDDIEVIETIERKEGETQQTDNCNETQIEDSSKEEIILVNEEFDEELEEEDYDQTSDKQSIVSNESNQNSVNDIIEDCEPEVDTKSGE